MELDFTFFVLAIPATLFAGISKGGFGSGAAFASAAILALAVEPGQALGVMLPLLMLIDVANLRPYWQQWHGPNARMLILASIPGVILGALFYTVVSADVFRLLIGAICLVFVAHQMACARGWSRTPPQSLSIIAGSVAGVTAGFTSFVSHAGGPPVAMFLLSQGLSKTIYQATTVIVFWAINILKFAPYAFLGIFTRDTLLANLFLIPFALIGARMGVWAHRKVPERLFFAITYILLVLTGIRLIWVALV